MSEKRLYDVIDKEEPRGQSVSYQGIPCTARHCCTNLNRLTEENEQLKKEYKIAINEMVTDYKKLEEENEQLRNQLERKTILLKIRTKHIDDRAKSFHELLNYLESFCYKSNIDGNYAKQDIINILNNWEIREYD